MVSGGLQKFSTDSAKTQARRKDSEMEPEMSVKVPQTKEEVIECIHEIFEDEFRSEVMVNLFLLHHEDGGLTVAQAYQNVLFIALGVDPIYKPSFEK